MTERTVSLGDAYALGYVGCPLLMLYAGAQVALCLLIAPTQPDLKLVVEPYLLLLGLILHVQWRKVTDVFAEHEVPRPVWVAAADCLSFIITFWAVAVLLEVFAVEMF